jgi:hypothetical protein
MIAALGAHLVTRGVAPSDLDFAVDSTMPVQTIRV